MMNIHIFHIAVPNLALGKTGWQSTNWEPWATPGAALDGDRGTHLFAGKYCSHTTTERYPAFAVDLGGLYEVTHVIITNRADCCSKYVYQIST